MRKYLITLLSSLLILQISIVSAATEINGIIIKKNGNKVKVNFRPSNNAWPAKGDKVLFFTELDGIKVSAGEGKVYTMRGATVWVESTDNRPDLNMKATIQATSQFYSKIKEFSVIIEGLDDIKFRGRVIQGWPRATIKVKLPDSFEYNYNSGASYFYIPEGSGRALFNTFYKISSDSLRQQHEQQRRNRARNENSNGYSRSSEIIWKDRSIEGIDTSCIASKVLASESSASSAGDSGKYVTFEQLFIASCSPHKQAIRKDNANLVYEFLFIIRAIGKDDFSADYWEKHFLNALRSLSIALDN